MISQRPPALTVTAAIALTIWAAAPANAHHSFSAVFDSEQQVATLAPDMRDFTAEGPNRRVEQAFVAGKLLAERAKAQGIESVVFDRGGYRYHGRVKAFADGAREGGLQF